jgi:hypothetical protein
LQAIALALGERTRPVSEFDAFHGEPGQARTSEDMSVDYALLKVPIDPPIDPVLIAIRIRAACHSPANGWRCIPLSMISHACFRAQCCQPIPARYGPVMDDSFEPSA